MTMETTSNKGTRRPGEEGTASLYFSSGILVSFPSATFCIGIPAKCSQGVRFPVGSFTLQILTTDDLFFAPLTIVRVCIHGYAGVADMSRARAGSGATHQARENEKTNIQRVEKLPVHSSQ